MLLHKSRHSHAFVKHYCVATRVSRITRLIADGRDMGTVVFPDAPVKIFLDASSEERAHRRMLQLQEKGFSVNFERLLAEIKERDDRDRNRAVAHWFRQPML